MSELKKGHRRASSDPSHLLQSTNTALRGSTPPPPLGTYTGGGFDFDSVDFNSLDALGNNDDIFDGSMLPNFEMGNLLKRHPSDGGVEDVLDHSAKKRKGHRRSQSDSNALLVGASYASIPGPSSAVDDWNVPQTKPSSRKKKQASVASEEPGFGKAGGSSKPLDKRNRRKPSAKAKQMKQMQDEEEAESNMTTGGGGDGNSPRYDDMLSADILDVLGNTSPHPDGDSPSNLPSGSPQFFKSDSEEQRAIDSAPLPTPISSSSSFLAANFSTNVMSESAEKAKMFMFGQGKGGSPIPKVTATRRKRAAAGSKKGKAKKDQGGDEGEKARGAYKCGRCGMYKVNHICTYTLELAEKHAETQTEGGKIKCEGKVLVVGKWGGAGGGGGAGRGGDKVASGAPVLCLPIEQTINGSMI
ncbi:hypothetical protein TrST_g10178 [Triparma strigata]|uniref:Uncharacterized protein n=1 Tax=Triparma strigata TaxID=1606541 RepID=A0A9W6ZMG9_9STRA|nr:hypothetical protein TrST_g10178 [Triparma strigata]